MTLRSAGNTRMDRGAAETGLTEMSEVRQACDPAGSSQSVGATLQMREGIHGPVEAADEERRHIEDADVGDETEGQGPHNHLGNPRCRW